MPDRGHVTIRDSDGTILATLLDLGGGCAIDSDVGTYTPDQAYEIGTVVLRWACRKRRQVRRAHEKGVRSG